MCRPVANSMTAVIATTNHSMRPLITAVFGPAPNRGRMAAYVKTSKRPQMKSATAKTQIQGCVDAASMFSRAIIDANAVAIKYDVMTKSNALATTPATSPPKINLRQLTRTLGVVP